MCVIVKKIAQFSGENDLIVSSLPNPGAKFT